MTDRKPFDTSSMLVSLRKGAGRGWVVAEETSTAKFRVRCLAHGTTEEITSSAADARAAVRLVYLWCDRCKSDGPLFDTKIPRGDLKCMLKTQTAPWEKAIAIVDVPDSHPAFFVDYKELQAHIPEGSSIELVEPRVLQLSGKKGRGLRTAKRFQAYVPLEEAQNGIVFIESVVASFGAKLLPAARPSPT
jgi:hypothetical protein